MAARAELREISNEEGNRLLRMIRRWREEVAPHAVRIAEPSAV